MRRRLYRYAIVLAASLPSYASGDGLLEARVSTASTTVAPLVEEKRMLLPGDLEYAIEVIMQCGELGDPQSLSLGVADTRNFIDLTEAGDTSTLVSTLMVPGAQLAPIVTQGYCVADRIETHTTMRVNDILTLQLSMRCSDQSIHYLSQPLGVSIDCVETPEDQESPSPSER